MKSYNGNKKGWLNMSDKKYVVCSKCHTANEYPVFVCSHCDKELYDEIQEQIKNGNTAVLPNEVEFQTTQNDFQTVQPVSSNSIGSFLKVLGVLILIIGFIAGFIIGYEEYEDFHWGLAFIGWGSSLISGIVLMGLGEIVLLLQRLVDKK